MDFDYVESFLEKAAKLGVAKSDSVAYDGWGLNGAEGERTRRLVFDPVKLRQYVLGHFEDVVFPLLDLSVEALSDEVTVERIQEAGRRLHTAYELQALLESADEIDEHFDVSYTSPEKVDWEDPVDKGIKERHSELLVLVTSKLETLLEGVEDATPLARKGQLEEALPYMDESTLCSRKAYDRFREWNNITFGTDIREIEMVPDLEDETPYWQHLRKNSSWLVDGIFVVGISAIGAAATQSYKGLLLGPAASLLEKTILLNHQRQLRGRNKKRIREETAMYNSLLGLDPKVELEGSLAVAKHRVQSILKDREGELINYGQLVTEVCSGHDWTRERNVTEDPTVLAGSQAARIVYHSLREIAKDERFIVELKGPQHVHVCTEIKYRANTELDPARSSLLTALNARGEQVSS